MRYYRITLILLGLFCILQCSNIIKSSENKPDPVVIIPHQSDMDFIESGIDAIPEKDAIFIQWRASNDEKVEHYNVYRSTNRTHKFQQLEYPVYVSDTTYIDEDVEIDIEYFYFVTCVNEDEGESISSDTLRYKLLDKAENLLPQGMINTKTPTFMWQEKNLINSSNYIIKVVESGDTSFIWQYRLLQNDIEFGGDQHIQFNKDSTASMQQLMSNHNYKWRVDKIEGHGTIGSESRWAVITIQ